MYTFVRVRVCKKKQTAIYEKLIHIYAVIPKTVSRYCCNGLFVIDLIVSEVMYTRGGRSGPKIISQYFRVFL